jgi:hypothetical protein
MRSNDTPPSDIERFPAFAEVQVTRMSTKEARDYRAKKLAEAWPDNKSYADQLLKQIEHEIRRMIPQVRAAVVAAHERFGLASVRDALLADPNNLDVFTQYEDCVSKYQFWSKRRRDWPVNDQFTGIEHPSESIPRAHKAQLLERGFSYVSMGWSDSRGALISPVEWRYLDGVQGSGKNSQTKLFWVDTANVEEIHARYDSLFNEVMEAAAPARESYREAYRDADAAIAAGLPISACPHPAGTIQYLAWERSRQGNGVRRPGKGDGGFEF